MKMLAKLAAAILVGILAIPSAATTLPAKKRGASQKKPEPRAAVEPPEPQPLLPYELPPTPPQVSYRGGQLSIQAENSTLSAVLQAVAKATGARLEGPMSGERVSVKLGPGAPRDVLAELLTGSNFNYVIVGSPANPAAVTAVTLTVRGGPPTPPRPGPPPGAFQREPVVEEDQSENVEPEPQVEPVVEQPPQGFTPEGFAPQPSVPAQPEASPQQPKTPQQLLQELQERLRKQQEEQQENK
ncbi:MAG TPA: hypothetical protein VLE48_13650 [Terriglobales bacterium]|nr:hypothetical protein [Terriglobales bacterium]